MNLNELILYINDILWGWPLIGLVVFSSLFVTFYLKGVQFRYFGDALRYLIQPSSDKGSGDMTPLQAFFNTLSASIGNGSLAGMATAIYSGGPGAAIWLFMFGFFAMALRFAEVYLGTAFGVRQLASGPIGGPMVYLQKIAGGGFLAYSYVFILLIFGLATGNAMQANSIQLGCVRILGVQPIIISTILAIFMAYVMFGGAKRIVDVSMKIAPVKVVLFFVATLIALVYHWQSLIPALRIMVESAFGMGAFAGGALGYTVQQALRFGLVRGVNASEAGLGTASVLFGGASSKDPVRTGIMSIPSSFITSNLVCFFIMWVIVASGVWNNGQTSIDLTISAYETVYGALGGWIVTFLAITFGLGTIVAYAYISRSCWIFLTEGRWLNFFNALFALVTLFGSLAKVDLIWNATDLINALLLLINLFAIFYLLPIIRQGLKNYQQREHSA